MNSKIRLLMVEDHQIVSDGLLKLLQDEVDIEVVEVLDNAQDALVYIDENQVDIVMSDITMPGMSGLEFTQIVAEKYITPKVCYFLCMKMKSMCLLLLITGRWAI